MHFLYLLAWPLLVMSSQAPRKVIYGKYYQLTEDNAADTMDNSFYLYTPPSNMAAPSGSSGKFPLVFQAIGNSWMKLDGSYPGPFTKMTPAIGSYLENGIAYSSLAYRATDMRYWYDIGGSRKAEELILVDNDGRLSLDTTGKTMGDYKCRACWMELITKCIYDTVEALEYLIGNADSLNIDVHRIFFLSSSAGSSVVNYLTYVYHQWHQDRFTPVGMILESPQFELPVYCALDKVWKNIMDHSSPDLLVSKLFDFSWCSHFVANALCGGDDHALNARKSGIQFEEHCNQTWMDITMKRWCTNQSSFQTATVSQLYETQKWNRDDPAVGRGMEKLWYVSQTMSNYHPKPFYLYVHSSDNFFIHLSNYVVAYARLADQVGINYTSYYVHYPGISASDLGYPMWDTMGAFAKTQLYYRSSIEWRGLYQKVHDTGAGSVEEHLIYVCFVLGISQCGPEVAKSLLL